MTEELYSFRVPTVDKLLKEWQESEENGIANAEFKPIKPGSFLMVFAPYEGTSPCYGWFYCNKCNNTWHSRLATLTSVNRYAKGIFQGRSKQIS